MQTMKPPEAIIVTDLFPQILNALLDLLSGLSAEQWHCPIARSTWTVKDTALHLLGDDVGILSRQRDGFSLPSGHIQNWNDLVAWLNRWNDEWLRATRRISPRRLCDLLRFTGTQVCAHFASRDLFALGGPVSWAGPQPAPVWLDVAREYTERWHHQQHIREALGKPGLMEPKFLAPVLDTFVRAWPHTYRDVDAVEGARVALAITGDAGGRWFLLRQNGAWHLYRDVEPSPHAEVSIPQEIAWRLFTRGMSQAEALAAITLRGDRPLGMKVLDMVSIIA